MANRDLKNNIKCLNLNEEINKILINNSITTLEDLWLSNRRKLKDLNLNDKQINDITVKLQLLGLDLNKKVY